ncbi:DUF5946 family protein [Tautonia sp. JC769]|uniref:DUF5946 family protein n=1 Tax=Tautonia sp. JC769 TaxID=3232135 RepID=UPI00345AB4E6
MDHEATWELEEAADCPSCGAPRVGGLDGCRALFDRLGEREFSDPEFFRAHRLTVDAYSLQHPEQFMKSSKSAAAHLAGMCWSMERGRSTHLPAPLKRWVDGRKNYARLTPPPPRARGTVTVIDVLDAEDAAEHERRVEAWARSAWSAWAGHWSQARAWVVEALEGSRAGV